jgi:hypothetical protein
MSAVRVGGVMRSIGGDQKISNDQSEYELHLVPLGVLAGPL